jgi:hypothetical protein
MRWRPGAITALLVAACAAACGGGGGHDRISVTVRPSFPQGFFPALLTGAGSFGDLAFRLDGDLYVVTGTSDVTSVARSDGAIRTFATRVGGASTALLSITPGAGTDTRLFAGDDAGRIWAIAGDGSSATLLIDTGSQPITGLSFAPTGFGDFGGSLFAAAGTSGVLRISLSDPPTVTPFASNGANRFSDLVFSATTLYTLESVDATHGQIDTVGATGGTPTKFQDGFIDPVGIALDTINSEIYVADAGDATHDGVLYTVPIAGGTPTRRANYDFDLTGPSGISFDGIATIAFVTSGPLAVRGSNLPRIDPNNANFGLIFAGPTVGYGDLELDRNGGFIVAANDDDDPNSSTDTSQNFLFSVPRDGSAVTTLASGIGPSGVPQLGEDLLGVAVDPVSQTIYVSSRFGNVYKRTSDGTVSLLVSVSSSPVLGLELAPAGFGSFGGDLVATTQDGRIFAIDPLAPNPTTQISLSQGVSRLSDLVFSATGTLYVVDNGAATSRILRVAPNGAVTDLQAPTGQLGEPDGIEIDEGGHRLLVTSKTTGGGRLLAVSLDAIPAAVTPLANISIDDGFFPTGVVYDRLGTAVFRQGNNSTSLKAVSVAP